MFTLLILV